MSNLRTAFAALAIVLLTLGWGGAALAAVGGRGSEWAIRLDGPATGGPIRLLALVVLLGAIGLAFVPEREPAP